jgi:hypothetical protein
MSAELVRLLEGAQNNLGALRDALNAMNNRPRPFPRHQNGNGKPEASGPALLAA